MPDTTIPSGDTVSTRRVTAADSRRWDEFVSRSEGGHVFQSWGWGELKRSSGWRPLRIAVLRDGEIRATAQILIQSRFGMSLAYVPRGPVVPSAQPHLLRGLLVGVHRVAREHHSVFLKVEPNSPPESALVRLLRAEGFVRSPQTMQPSTTMVVDLAGGADAVLARLDRKTRWYIRQSEKRGALVRPAGSDEDIRAFHRLMVETGRRGSFPIRPAAYFRDMLEQLRPRGQADLLLAEWNGEAIAGALVLAYGREGIYLYAASSAEHRDKLASYLLIG